MRDQASDSRQRPSARRFLALTFALNVGLCLVASLARQNPGMAQAATIGMTCSPGVAAVMCVLLLPHGQRAAALGLAWPVAATSNSATRGQ